jgi:hypothetical protein
MPETQALALLVAVLSDLIACHRCRQRGKNDTGIQLALRYWEKNILISYQAWIFGLVTLKPEMVIRQRWSLKFLSLMDSSNT